MARAGRFSMLESWPASVVSGGRSSCLTSKMHRSRLLWLFYDTICFVTLFIDHVHIKRPTNNSLLTAQNAVSRRFRENIRSYNSALSLASGKSFFWCNLSVPSPPTLVPLCNVTVVIPPRAAKISKKFFLGEITGGHFNPICENLDRQNSEN